MRYKEYRVSIGDLEKKLGILSESHIYSAEDSKLAEEIISQYQVLASEGSQQSSPSMVAIAMLYLPVSLAYMAGTGRSVDNPVAYKLAKSLGKPVVWLESEPDTVYSLKQKIALAAFGLLTIPFSPLIYLFFKRLGDPADSESKSYKLFKQYEEKLAERGKPGLIDALGEYAIFSNFDSRNSTMVSGVVQLLESPIESLLLSCGDGHLEGIVEELEARLDLTETDSPFNLP